MAQAAAEQFNQPRQQSTLLQAVEIGGGRVERLTTEGPIRLVLPPTESGYADAQVDDYRFLPRRRYPWRPGTVMSLSARFSHRAEALKGTAGFGFWNAPFGPGTATLPTLPSVAWFFFGSPPTDLPLAPPRLAGRGWFCATLAPTISKTLLWLPLAPLVLLLNQRLAWRQRLLPMLQRQFGISYARLDVNLTELHGYRLEWRASGCYFFVDDKLVLSSPGAPVGPLGFVAWIDNQFLVATARGHIRWGTLATERSQSLEMSDLVIARTSSR